ncbi:hypothetical protein TARUN_7499 [Trichoderma arundinaceum]|uniref:Uncharacterized protein n=1 Tax=Trichoderma arundinaceum TaxID=490622 RepID=A0A395NFN3_TRIAR|nr:hypothetical protein TARUN_7499 [Trichoderma arundinaceum]
MIVIQSAAVDAWYCSAEWVHYHYELAGAMAGYATLVTIVLGGGWWFWAALSDCDPKPAAALPGKDGEKVDKSDEGEKVRDGAPDQSAPQCQYRCRSGAVTPTAPPPRPPADSSTPVTPLQSPVAAESLIPQRQRQQQVKKKKKKKEEGRPQWRP